MKLLLHACCGPCSLEPTRLLREAGHKVTIYFANSNIAPANEYARRRETLQAWAAAERIPVLEGPYTPETWEAAAGRFGLCEGDDLARQQRCRACYRLRFEEAAQVAASKGFDALGTTLSVSPYQYTQIIHDELSRAGTRFGVDVLFEDYRPFYDEATRRSREAGMYRQNFCGCRFSAQEAAAEREARKQERAAAREAQAAAHAQERAAEEAARAERRAERLAYAEKQAKKHEILKTLREQQRHEQ